MKTTELTKIKTKTIKKWGFGVVAWSDINVKDKTKTEIYYQPPHYEKITKNVSPINLFVNPKPSIDGRKCICKNIFLIIINCKNCNNLQNITNKLQ